VAELSVQAFTVYDLITRGALVHGEAPAVIQGERVLSFRALQSRVDTLAGGLDALGLAAGDRICVLAQNDAAYLELYGACARQGLVAYPINWRLTAQEVERVVERARPSMMVVDASTRPLVGDWLESAGVRHRYRLGEGGAAADLAPLETL
jgi:acyl-CoA synthetase (AMP-forming)/AMP-acid ligase II